MKRNKKIRGNMILYMNAYEIRTDYKHKSKSLTTKAIMNIRINIRMRNHIRINIQNGIEFKHKYDMINE